MGQKVLWNAALLPQGRKLLTDTRKQSQPITSHETDLQDWRTSLNWSVCPLCFTSHWWTDICTNTEVHPPPPVKDQVLGAQTRTWHTSLILRCQPASPAILIVISPQPWYEQKGRPRQNLAHQRLPPLVLQVACLFGGARASKSQKRGLERQCGFPAGMSLMG